MTDNQFWFKMDRWVPCFPMFQLLWLEKVRIAVLKLDYLAYAEIKSYHDPPSQVFDIMAATFVLLGEENHLQVRMNMEQMHHDIL